MQTAENEEALENTDMMRLIGIALLLLHFSFAILPLSIGSFTGLCIISLILLCIPKCLEQKNGWV
jgi:hypothetical protein